MNNAFEDRLAVVTGASSGIGLAVTERLLTQGARVLAMSRQIGGLNELAERFATQLSWVSGDVTQPADLERLAQQASTLGRSAIWCRMPALQNWLTVSISPRSTGNGQSTEPAH